MTVGQFKKNAVSLLKDSPTPALDVDVLLQFFLNLDKTHLLMSRDEIIAGDILRKLNSAVEQRKNGLPVAYITGHKEFFGLDFAVSPAVLIPKPDTELLVELAVNSIESITSEKKIRVLDMCTGSGCVGISLFKTLSSGVQIELTLADISTDALNIAQNNAKRLLGSDTQNIQFIQTNLFQNISGSFDMIVTNPPYVPHNEAVELLQDGRSEPLLALDGDVNSDTSWNGQNDGLSVIKRLVVQAKDHLADGGLLLMETGEYNARATADFFAQNGFTGVIIEKDLNALLRVVRGSYNFKA